MADDMVPAEESHNDGIEHICDALLLSGLWQEIDGDGTEYSIIADHIRQLVRERAEAVRLLRHALDCLTDPHAPEADGWAEDLAPIEAFLGGSDG